MIRYNRTAATKHAKEYYLADASDIKDFADFGSPQWVGALRERFGLRGAVDSRVWGDAVDGKFPGGITVPGGGDGNRRAGEDIVFEAPKSFSVGILAGGDRTLLTVHKEAVEECIQEFETWVGTRMGRQGAEFAVTGKMLGVAVSHFLNRENEPHLHTHVMCLNVTESADGKVKANDLSYAYQNQGLLRTLYNVKVYQKAIKAGYSVAFDDKGTPQLEGFGKDMLSKYSTRGAAILAWYEKHGINPKTATPKQQDMANKATRPSAGKEKLTPSHLAAYKEKEASWGVTSEKALEASKRTPRDIKYYGVYSRESAKNAVLFALASHTEREFVTKEELVLATALRHGKGRLSLEDIKDAYEGLKASGDVIVSEADTKDKRKGLRVVTRESLDLETTLKRLEKAGRRTIKPLMGKEDAEAVLDAKYAHLNANQRGAFTHIMSTENRMIHVSGAAGVGKTTMLAPAVKELVDTGHTVVGLGPVWSAVKAMAEVEVKSGTLAAFVRKRQSRERQPNTVYMLDEANLADTASLVQLQKIVAMQGARLVLIGDIKQLNSVAAGAPLEVLVESGMETSHITEMQRQRNAAPEVKQAAQESLDSPTLSLATMEAAGRVTRTEDAAGEAWQRAKGYGIGPETIILTPRHKTIAEITARAREEYGLTQKPALSVETFEPSGEVTDAMRRNIAALEDYLASRPEGTVALRAGRHYKNLGIEKGAVVWLEGVDTVTGKLRLRDAASRCIIADSRKFAQFEVGEVKTRDFAVGDIVRAAGNAYFDKASQTGVMRHTRGEVVHIDERTKQLTVQWWQDGRAGLRQTIATDTTQELSYGYAQTIASVEGLSAKNVVMVSPGTRREYYLALTRTKGEAHIVDTVDVPVRDTEGSLGSSLPSHTVTSRDKAPQAPSKVLHKPLESRIEEVTTKSRASDVHKKRESIEKSRADLYESHGK